MRCNSHITLCTFKWSTYYFDTSIYCKVIAIVASANASIILCNIIIIGTNKILFLSKFLNTVLSFFK